jgi:hypothetical protein
MPKSPSLSLPVEEREGDFGKNFFTLWWDHLTPHDIIDLSSDEVRKVAVGYKQSCALIATSKVRCWGINSHH